MRSYVYASLAAHLAATLLWGVVTVVLRQPLEPLEMIQVDLATLPVKEIPKEDPKPLPEPPKEVVEDPAPEPVIIPPKPKPIEDRRPEPEIVEKADLEEVPSDEIVPPEPDLPPPPTHEKPEQTEDLDFLEPEDVAPAISEESAPEAEVQEQSTPVPTAGVEVERQEGMPDYYLALMQNKINRRWDPSAARTRGGAQALCMIRFRVSPAGVILEPRVAESSGFSVFDREALSAVIAASPLPTPPAESRVTELPITVRFNLDR